MRIEEIRRENLRWLIETEFRGIALNLARALGVQASQVTRVFLKNPQTRRNIGRNFAQNIEQLTGKPSGWMDLVHDFVNYDAPPARLRRPDTTTETSLISNVEPGPALHRIVPVLSWSGAAEWVNMHDDALTQQVKEELLCPVYCGKRTFALRVRGVSMEPRFREGELIFVDPDADAEHGKFVVVSLAPAQEPVFRQLLVEGGKRYLKALNKDWPEHVIEVTDAATFLGVVIFKGEVV